MVIYSLLKTLKLIIILFLFLDYPIKKNNAEEARKIERLCYGKFYRNPAFDIKINLKKTEANAGRKPIKAHYSLVEIEKLKALVKT
jgi:hypothetical protein